MPKHDPYSDLAAIATSILPIVGTLREAALNRQWVDLNNFRTKLRDATAELDRSLGRLIKEPASLVK